MLKTFALTAGLCLIGSNLHAEQMMINGASLEFEIKGSGSTVLFFEAGAISGMAGWDSIWPKLPDNMTAIRYSRRGEGNSGTCEGDLTAKDYVRDAETLLKRLVGAQPIVYVSHSYGGKIAREYARQHPSNVTAMLFVDPVNPRDVEIIETLDPVEGPKQNEEVKQADISMGQQNHWCLINDLWDKSPALGVKEIGDIPITLIAGVKKFAKPERLFDQDQARELWGKYQAEWVNAFPRGKAVMAINSGHFVQDDQPELVIDELMALIARIVDLE